MLLTEHCFFFRETLPNVVSGDFPLLVRWAACDDSQTSDKTQQQNRCEVVYFFSVEMARSSKLDEPAGAFINRDTSIPQTVRERMKDTIICSREVKLQCERI